MTALRFVHAADLHLDSPLRGLERYPGAPVDEIRSATRRATTNLVELCLSEEVALLVIAGDLYDGDWRDYGTGLFFIEQLGKLTREGVRVVWVRGNHDAASQITRSLRPPEGSYELGTVRPETLCFEDLGIAVHGQSYAMRDVSEDLAARYPEPRTGYFNLGLLHTALDGREGHAPYAPCSLERLRSKGYEYWALGHVHAREVVCEDPWVVFPGNLQGRHARETGPKGATLVSVDDANVVQVAHRELDVVRWEEIAISVEGCERASDVLDRAATALADGATRNEDRLLAARIRVYGTSPAHDELLRQRSHLEQELRALALGTGSSIWVEKILLDVERPRSTRSVMSADHPTARLMAAIGSAAEDVELRREILASLAPLVEKLPPAYREQPDALSLEDPAGLRKLLAEVSEEILPRLLERGE